MRSALWMMGWAGLCAGCLCGPPTDGPGGGGGGGFIGVGGGGGGPNGACTVTPLPAGGPVRVGAPFEATLGVSVFACADGGSPHATATVSAIDPMGVTTALPASAVARTTINSSESFTVRAAFTPDRPGTWGLTVTFAPSGATASGTFLAVEPRTGAGARVVAVDPAFQYCVEFGVLASGVPVCAPKEGVPPTGELVMVGATPVPGQRFAVDADAVWVWQGPTVERWAPSDGGAAVRTHALTFSAGGPNRRFLVARDGAAFVADDPQSVARLRAGPGPAMDITPQSIGARTVGGLFTSAGHLLVQGRPAGTSGGAAFIALGFDGGGLVTATALNLTSDGVPDEGVWWTERSDFVGPELVSVLKAVRWDSAGFFDVRDLAVPFRGAIASRLAPQTPLMPFGDAGFVAVPTATSSGVGLEVFDPGAGFGPVIGATATHVFALSTDGTNLKIIER